MLEPGEAGDGERLSGHKGDAQGIGRGPPRGEQTQRMLPAMTSRAAAGRITGRVATTAMKAAMGNRLRPADKSSAGGARVGSP